MLFKYPFKIILHFAQLKLQETFTPGIFLSEDNINSDPITQFGQWYKQAVKAHIPFYEAMTLSTADSTGKPSGRMVLLKSFDQHGFVFFSNENSRKGKELLNNNFASLTFFWSKLGKQVRIEGTVETISEFESDEYFSTRPRASQIGARASEQSCIIPHRKYLIENIEKLEKQYKGNSVPRPPHWIGYRLIPNQIEFWQNRTNRLHDRFLFMREGNQEWEINRLAP